FTRLFPCRLLGSAVLPENLLDLGVETLLVVVEVVVLVVLGGIGRGITGRIFRPRHRPQPVTTLERGVAIPVQERHGCSYFRPAFGVGRRGAPGRFSLSRWSFAVLGFGLPPISTPRRAATRRHTARPGPGGRPARRRPCRL